jgi:hypothetical protein
MGEQGNPPVVRLHLRSTLKHVNHEKQEQFCIAEPGYAGVGWGCWDGDAPSGISWDDYCRRKIADDGEVNDSVRRLYELPEGALIWTRKKVGSSYWLGEVIGPWEYRGDQTARDHDLFNLRPVRWRQVGTEDAVPGKVVNNFRGTKTLNPVRDYGACQYTYRLYRQLFEGAQETDSPPVREVLTSLLGSEDLEDLVAVYLQDRYDLVLVDRGRSTPGYEYVLRRRDGGRKAVASVKAGGTHVDLALLPDDPDVDCFWFSVSGHADGNGPQATQNKIDELIEFCSSRAEILPDRVRRWLEPA